MSAIILPFMPQLKGWPSRARAQIVAVAAERFGVEWSRRHQPLVSAALDMLQAEDEDFADRCRLIDSEPGALGRLADQLSKLASHMTDVAEALAITVRRIRVVSAASTCS